MFNNIKALIGFQHVLQKKLHLLNCVSVRRVVLYSGVCGPGVYSLEWARLGQCLHTAVLEQSAVSVALSPTARHLAVGLGSRRFTTAPHARNNVIALLYRLEPLGNYIKHFNY